jgi:hypothetical protein
MRTLAREEAARIIRQVDRPDENGTIIRLIAIRWNRQKRLLAGQIKGLQDAVLFGCPFAIERDWFGLTPHWLDEAKAENLVSIDLKGSGHTPVYGSGIRLRVGAGILLHIGASLRCAPPSFRYACSHLSCSA